MPGVRQCPLFLSWSKSDEVAHQDSPGESASGRQPWCQLPLYLKGNSHGMPAEFPPLVWTTARRGKTKSNINQRRDRRVISWKRNLVSCCIPQNHFFFYIHKHMPSRCCQKPEGNFPLETYLFISGQQKHKDRRLLDMVKHILQAPRPKLSPDPACW